MEKLNFALIGCGRIGKRHALHIENIGDLIAVCDIKKENAKSFGDEFNANIYYDIDDLLDKEEKIDIVSICTPHHLHVPNLEKIAQAGKHAIIEKPLAITCRC